jgi:hypothetical protein
MKTDFVRDQTPVVVVPRESGSEPLRSSVISNLLAQASQGSREAIGRPVFRVAWLVSLWNWLRVDHFPDRSGATKASVIFTPGGPLVYRWEMNESDQTQSDF